MIDMDKMINSWNIFRDKMISIGSAMTAPGNSWDIFRDKMISIGSAMTAPDGTVWFGEYDYGFGAGFED